MSDLTAVYYTANSISEGFFRNTWYNLKRVFDEEPMIVVALLNKAYDEQNKGTYFAFERKELVKLPRHHLSIYKQALIGAKAAKTKYIALCEDDILYSPEHFKYRPSEGKFAYNMGTWNIHTWGEPLFTIKGGGRINLHSLVCERKLFIEAMEERFAKWGDSADIRNWAEPGKYEKNLGVTVREVEYFYTNPPNIAFSHQTALSFDNLGTRKRLGEVRATEIPYWGRAEDIVKLYEGNHGIN